VARAIPTVTIGLPVRNGEPFLEQAIESLLAQTFRDFELIVSDNASDDNTPAIIARFARQDSRIRVFRFTENVGAAANYNRVLHEARAPYFKWAADDDVCLPTFLEACLEVLQSRPEVVLCYPKTRLIDENSLPLRDYEDRYRRDRPSPSSRFRTIVRRMVAANLIFGLIRTDVLRSTNLMGNYVGADGVLVAELALRGTFHEVPDRLFLRRFHPAQSVQAHRTPGDLTRWWDPAKKEQRIYPNWKLLRELARAVQTAPLLPNTRWACYGQLFHWALRRWRKLLREVVTGGSLTCDLRKRVWRF
jgi:glycosyltransferase involved in cell wall biosynthesis